MRLIPSTPLAPLGAAVAAVVLLSGCEGSDFDFDFDLDTDFFSSDSEESPDPSADPSPGEEGEEEEEDSEEEEQASNHGLPDSCEAAGVTEVVGDLAPGTVLDEESGEVEGIDDAEQLVCTLGDGSGEAEASSFVLVYTVNVDPSTNPDVLRVAEPEEEMNWDVDVDVDVDTYHTDESDDLGGDLEYVSALDGSSSHLYLELPDDFYITAIAYHDEVDRADLERVVFQAAERTRG